MTAVVRALSAVSFVSNEIRQCQMDTVLTFLLVYSAGEQNGLVTSLKFMVQPARQCCF